MARLHNLIEKVPPVVTTPHKAVAVYVFNSLPTTGTRIPLCPFFGTLMGWVGVAMTGSDSASNMLVGLFVTMQADVWPFTLMVVH